MTSLVRLLLAALTAAVLFISRSADACGCFAAPPVVTTPVIQGGCSTVADPVMLGLFALVASWRRRLDLRPAQR
jgi:hypothetical protein